jgi:chromosome segregation ATPase
MASDWEDVVKAVIKDRDEARATITTMKSRVSGLLQKLQQLRLEKKLLYNEHLSTVRELNGAREALRVMREAKHAWEETQKLIENDARRGWAEKDKVVVELDKVRFSLKSTETERDQHESTLNFYKKLVVDLARTAGIPEVYNTDAMIQELKGWVQIRAQENNDALTPRER